MCTLRWNGYLGLCASSTTRYWQIVLHLGCVQFLVPPAVHPSSHLSTPATELVLSDSLIFANLMYVKLYFTVVLTEISLVNSKVNTFSYVYLPCLLSLLWSACLCLLLIFLLGSLAFSYWHLEVIYICWIIVLCLPCVAIIFSQFVACLFTCVCVYLDWEF